MKCYTHPDVEAVGTCVSCGKAVCTGCAVDVAGKIHCQRCVAVGAARGASATGGLPTNPLAIVSLVLGVLGLLGGFCTGPIGALLLGAPAAVTGWVARQQLAESGQDQQGMQFATIGLVLGGVVVALSLVLTLLALIIWGGSVGLGLCSSLFGQRQY